MNILSTVYICYYSAKKSRSTALLFVSLIVYELIFVGMTIIRNTFHYDIASFLPHGRSLPIYVIIMMALIFFVSRMYYNDRRTSILYDAFQLFSEEKRFRIKMFSILSPAILAIIFASL